MDHRRCACLLGCLTVLATLWCCWVSCCSVVYQQVVHAACEALAVSWHLGVNLCGLLLHHGCYVSLLQSSTASKQTLMSSRPQTATAGTVRRLLARQQPPTSPPQLPASARSNCQRRTLTGATSWSRRNPLSKRMACCAGLSTTSRMRQHHPASLCWTACMQTYSGQLSMPSSQELPALQQTLLAIGVKLVAMLPVCWLPRTAGCR